MSLYLPFGCWLSRNDFFESVDEPCVAVGALRIKHEHLRGTGVGERLVRALAVVAAGEDHDLLHYRAQSTYALSVSSKVFGEDRLELGPVVREDGTESDPPSDLEEARGLLGWRNSTVGSLWRLIGRGHSQVRSVDLRVNIGGMDVRGWDWPEMPRAPAVTSAG